MTDKQVRNLRGGEILSNGCIIEAVWESAYLPSNKRYVLCQYPKESQPYKRIWGAYTVVGVKGFRETGNKDLTVG